MYTKVMLLTLIAAGDVRGKDITGPLSCCVLWRCSQSQLRQQPTWTSDKMADRAEHPIQK